jgi:hypothetical protein
MLPSLYRLTLFALSLCAVSAAQSQGRGGWADGGQRMPDRPTAQLQIYGSHDISSTWSGAGTNMIAADLCVASSTGRFRLQIQSAGGGRMASVHSLEKMAYTLRFRDGAGQEQRRRVNGEALVTLEGSSAQDRDCSHGANSTIEIDLSEPDMLSRTAGRYFDQLRFSVDPL